MVRWHIIFCENGEPYGSSSYRTLDEALEAYKTYSRSGNEMDNTTYVLCSTPDFENIRFNFLGD